MPVISFVKKKMGSAYLVWLENSNTYIRLEEPAWFVFNQLVKRHKAITTARATAIGYGWRLDESVTFTTDMD